MRPTVCSRNEKTLHPCIDRLLLRMNINDSYLLARTPKGRTVTSLKGSQPYKALIEAPNKLEGILTAHRTAIHRITANPKLDTELKRELLARADAEAKKALAALEVAIPTSEEVLIAQGTRAMFGADGLGSTERMRLELQVQRA